MNTDFVIDNDLNYNTSLPGYPNVRQFGTYNESISIDNESAAPTYKRTATDDLSHVWATNNADSIGGTNKILHDANVNAYDEDFYGASEFYGAKDLHVVYSNPDFSRFLEPRHEQRGMPESYEFSDVEGSEECEHESESRHLFLWFLFFIFVAIMGFGGFTNVYNKVSNAVSSVTN